jgi:MFS family permease
MSAPTTVPPIRLGLRANLAQFTLLVAVNALVGGMIGQERTVLPLLAGQVFAVGAFTASLMFIVAFGITKALANLAAGGLSDRYGRKPVLVAGWLIGLPVPLLLIWAPDWGWVIAANVLLGLNQGLTWSTTIVMKVDLVGPRRRGLAMGFNEAAGYVAVAGTGMATGWLAAQYGLRPAPFRRPRPRPVHHLRTRDTPPRPARSPHPHPTPRRPPRRTDLAADLHPHQRQREGPVRGQPSRPREQP